MFAHEPGKTTVIFGPPNCGKTRLLQELRDSYAIDKNAPPFLYINGRKVPLTRPEEICRALCQQILSKDFDIWLNNQSTATRDKVLDNLQGTSLALGSQSKVISCTNTGALQTPRGSLSAALKNILRKDENNFDRNLKNVGVLFAALKPVDRKPVLVIDAAHNLTDWKEDDVSHQHALPVFQAAAAASPKEDVPYPQCFDFSSTQSVSGDNYEYLPTGSTNGTLKTAVLGQLIDFKCASVVCPNPPTPNCYYDPSVCTSAEWCMLDSQILWGPWAFGAKGETPGASGHAGIQCADAEAAGMSWWYDTVCSNTSSWGPFENVRGRCVPYRTDQQSCQPELRERNALFGPTYPVRDNGNPFVRPLRCAPGLVCTGDVEPTPNTCVPVRPPNVCFQGPWWNSTWCKVGGAAGGEYTTGLPQQALEDAAASVILQLPQEKLKPVNANFWYEGIANRTRDEISRVIETLWPEAYRANTTFPLASIPDPRLTGPPYTAAWNATAAAASSIMTQTPRVWSAIHTLIHNALDPMPSSQIWASRALAVFLVQNFQCPDCRGEFEVSVLSIIGLPPSSSSRQDHQKWWWRAHNMVSEHTTSTRGGLPWLYLAQTPQEFSENVGASAGNTEVLKCQNPFFLPYEDAVTMWKIE